jgi:hypothetical protein
LYTPIAVAVPEKTVAAETKEATKKDKAPKKKEK